MAHGLRGDADRAGVTGGNVPNTVRSFVGRKMSGPVMGLRATQDSRGWRLTVQQKHGPAQNFLISTGDRPAQLAVRRLLSAVRVVVGVFVMIFSFLLMVTGVHEQFADNQPLSGFIGAELTFLVTLLLGQRLVFTNSLRRRYQVCPHIPQIAAVLQRADPATGTWAVEAVDALREGSFCLGSPQLHAMAAVQPAPLPVREAAASAAGQLAGQIQAAAAALETHGRAADAAVVRELLECVPELAVLDQAAVEQAAHAVARSYELLDEVPVTLRKLPAAPDGPTPQQDAEASVAAALAELTRLVRVHANSDIQALQALRIYTRQWDRTDPLDL